MWATTAASPTPTHQSTAPQHGGIGPGFSLGTKSRAEGASLLPQAEAQFEERSRKHLRRVRPANPSIAFRLKYPQSRPGAGHA